MLCRAVRAAVDPLPMLSTVSDTSLTATAVAPASSLTSAATTANPRPAFARAGSLDRGIEREKFRLGRDGRDHLRDCAHVIRRIAQIRDRTARGGGLRRRRVGNLRRRQRRGSRSREHSRRAASTMLRRRESTRTSVGSGRRRRKPGRRWSRRPRCCAYARRPLRVEAWRLLSWDSSHGFEQPLAVGQHGVDLAEKLPRLVHATIANANAQVARTRSPQPVIGARRRRPYARCDDRGSGRPDRPRRPRERSRFGTTMVTMISASAISGQRAARLPGA